MGQESEPQAHAGPGNHGAGGSDTWPLWGFPGPGSSVLTGMPQSCDAGWTVWQIPQTPLPVGRDGGGAEGREVGHPRTQVGQQCPHVSVHVFGMGDLCLL